MRDATLWLAIHSQGKRETSLTAASNPPQRRITVELTIQADDRESLLACLDCVRQDLRQGVVGNTTGGATGFGYAAKISDDGKTTPQQYADDLRRYLESNRKEGC